MDAKSGNPMKPMTMTKGQVRALLAGSTTLQQRMRPQPPNGTVRLECGRYCPTVARGGFMDAGSEVFGAWSPRDDWAQVCPYQPGNVLWGKESYTYRERHDGENFLVYLADGSQRSLGEWKYPHPIYEDCVGMFGQCFPARSMPIWAARIFREVVSASVSQDGVLGWVWTYEFREIPKPNGE